MIYMTIVEPAFLTEGPENEAAPVVDVACYRIGNKPYLLIIK